MCFFKFGGLNLEKDKDSRLQQVINHIKQEKENLDMIIKNIEDGE